MPDTNDIAPANRTFGTGKPVRRIEDSRLIRGGGRYTDDISRPDQAYLAMVRSAHAHGVIRTIRAEAAARMPGVLGVVTQNDLDAAGFGRLVCLVPLKNADGTPLRATPRTILAGDKVRFVGDPVAAVVATSPAAACDAADAVEIDIDPLPALTSPEDAMRPGAPLIYDDVPGNLVLDYRSGDAQKVAAAFARAAHVTRLGIDNQRLAVAAMEPRAALGQYDTASGRYTLHIPTQGVVGARTVLARDILRCPPEQVRVISEDVGGSFGMKNAAFPEYACVLYAARLLGRPVKWTDERTTSFVSDTQGRSSRHTGELALDERGRILALRITGIGDMGAYLGPFGPLPASAGTVRNTASVYATPLIESAITCVLTNAPPISAYRGAGRPEGNYIMERLLDAAAAEMGIDPITIRRRNFIKPRQIPFTTAGGAVYDSGDFPAVFERALMLADYQGFARRRKESRKRGRLRGIAAASYLEVTAGNLPELGAIRFGDDGTVTYLTGSFDFGQGHRTTFLQVLSEKLDVPIERLRLQENDSDEVKRGGGTGGSRSLMASGAAMLAAADELIDKGRRAAGYMLEAARDDIVFSNGRFAIVGTDRSIGVIELALKLKAAGDLPGDVPASLDTELMHDGVPSTFPNGAQVVEVEVDPDTGAVEVMSYVGVNDFGTIVNPMIVAGQVHGGVAQGLGQALMERVVLDGAGQMLTGSFQDYALPRAGDMPPMVLDSLPKPATTNPLGVKGCGEAGCAGGLPTVVNAVIAALAEYGIRHLNTPLTPEKIWRAIRDSQPNQAASAAKRG